MIRELTDLRRAMRELAISPEIVIILRSRRDADRLLASMEPHLAKAVGGGLVANNSGGVIRILGMTICYPSGEADE